MKQGEQAMRKSNFTQEQIDASIEEYLAHKTKTDEFFKHCPIPRATFFRYLAARSGQPTGANGKRHYLEFHVSESSLTAKRQHIVESIGRDPSTLTYDEKLKAMTALMGRYHVKTLSKVFGITEEDFRLHLKPKGFKRMHHDQLTEMIKKMLPALLSINGGRISANHLHDLLKDERIQASRTTLAIILRKLSRTKPLATPLFTENALADTPISRS